MGVPLEIRLSDALKVIISFSAHLPVGFSVIDDLDRLDRAKSLEAGLQHVFVGISRASHEQLSIIFVTHISWFYFLKFSFCQIKPKEKKLIEIKATKTSKIE